MSAQQRRRRGHHDEAHANHERWLLTYADMITLLMVLFIVMFAISQVDQKKFAELRDGLAMATGGSQALVDGGSGVLPQASGNNPQAPPVQLTQIAARQEADQARQADRDRLAAAQAQIVAALKAKGLDKSVVFSRDDRGLVLTIVTDEVLFPTGSADLQAMGREVLDAVSPTLATLPNPVTVEGHTDDVPISGHFPSNWELSAVRATTVVRYLLATPGLDPHRLSAAGFADERGLAPNDSEANRARNRRVEVVVLAMPTTATSPDPAAPAVPLANAAPAAPAAPDVQAGG